MNAEKRTGAIIVIAVITIIIYLGIRFQIWLSKTVNKEKERLKNLKENGIKGTALVIKSELSQDEGVYPQDKPSNHVKHIKFYLKVTKIDGSKFEATANIWIDITQFYLMEPDKEFKIIYDPKDISSIIIDPN